MHPTKSDSNRGTLTGKAEIAYHSILPLSTAGIIGLYATSRRWHRQALDGGVVCYGVLMEAPEEKSRAFLWALSSAAAVPWVDDKKMNPLKGRIFDLLLNKPLL